MRKPKSKSSDVHPEDGGVAVHWGGTGNTPTDHNKCEERWRGWQNYHMDNKDWADIAYNFGFCNHGYVLAGRGYGVRSAAQGTNDGNERFMAAVFVGGEDGPNANEDAFDALEWIIAECRHLGADDEVRPHSYFHSTGCPGDHIRSKLSRYHNKPVPYPPGEVIVAEEEKDDMPQLTDLVPVVGSAARFLEARGAVLQDKNGNTVPKGKDGYLKYEWFVVWSYIELVQNNEAIAEANKSLNAIEASATSVDSKTPPAAG